MFRCRRHRKRRTCWRQINKSSSGDDDDDKDDDEDEDDWPSD